jgi:DNA-binding MltR family transcriptional regulator
MGGRINVEADDILEFLGKLRVVRQLEGPDAVRRELVAFIKVQLGVWEKMVKDADIKPN